VLPSPKKKKSKKKREPGQSFGVSTFFSPRMALCSPPPYLRLYKHALESIFSHLNLPELARISATCRDWSAAVNSMRPIGASAGRRGRLDIDSMRASRLRRHVLEIYVANGRIGGVSEIHGLCEFIKQSTLLAILDLSNNAIGDVGVSAIAKAIKQSQSLTTVHLSWNFIGYVGVCAIAEAIKQRKSSTNVKVCWN